MSGSVLKDLSGQKFGRLTVVRYHSTKVFPSGQSKPQWLCKCDCGESVVVYGAHLRRQSTQSCGCLQREKTSSANRIHGKSEHRLYHIWENIRERCNCPTVKNWMDYGGRGITVCERWDNFQAFYDDMAATYKPGLSIERKDNNKGYSPENCKWATRIEQANNRRTNRLLFFNGQILNESQWSKITGLSRTLISTRLKAGWTIQKTLGTPARKGNYRRGKA